MDKSLQRSGSAFAVAVGLLLGGCDMDMTINGVEGVPLSEIDQSGPPPTELIMAGSDKVILSESDTLTIEVEGDEEAVEALRFVRDGDVLGVSREDGSWWDNDGSAIVRIGMPAPSEIILGGSGEIEAETIAINGEIVIGGSGSLSIAKVASESLEVLIGGSGSLTAAGSSKALDLTIGGSGSGNLRRLKADDVEISIGGSGSVKLMSDGNVDANIGGSGSVNVIGDAKCSLESFGSGSLNCTPGKDTAKSKGKPADE